MYAPSAALQAGLRKLCEVFLSRICIDTIRYDTMDYINVRPKAGEQPA